MGTSSCGSVEVASMSSLKRTWPDARQRQCGSQKYAALSTFVIICAAWNCHDEDAWFCATCGGGDAMNRALVLISHLLSQLGMLATTEVLVSWDIRLECV
jgi:hypothetical protein